MLSRLTILTIVSLTLIIVGLAIIDDFINGPMALINQVL